MLLLNQTYLANNEVDILWIYGKMLKFRKVFIQFAYSRIQTKDISLTFNGGEIWTISYGTGIKEVQSFIPEIQRLLKRL